METKPKPKTKEEKKRWGKQRETKHKPFRGNS